MHTAWLKGHKDKEARRNQIKACVGAFDLLKEVLERDFKKRDSVRDYSNPNWMAEQIAVNEHNAVVDDVLRLLEIKE